LPDPFDGVAFGEELLGRIFHDLNGFAGTYALHGGAGELSRKIPVHSRQGFRTRNAFDGENGCQGNHFSRRRRTHPAVPDVFGRQAEAVFGLHHDAVDTAVTGEVVDEGTGEKRRERVKDVFGFDAEPHGFFFIEIDADRGGLRADKGAQSRELAAFAESLQKVARHGLQLQRIIRPARLNVTRKAVRRAQTSDGGGGGGRCDRTFGGGTDLAKHLKNFVGGLRAFLPWLEFQNEGSSVGADIAPLAVKACHDENTRKSREFLCNFFTHGVAFCAGADEGSPFGERHRHAQNPLVFRRHETRRRVLQKLPGAHGDGDENEG